MALKTKKKNSFNVFCYIKLDFLLKTKLFGGKLVTQNNMYMIIIE